MKKVKRIALVAAAAIVSLTVNAQDALVATLQHGDNMQAFYGGNALKQALEAAQTGDVISLSPGTFNATDITKAVTIQGAGYVQNSANSRYRTAISGSTNIKLPAEEKGLIIEGIYFSSYSYVSVYNEIENMIFKKCYLHQISMQNNGCISKDCSFIQCRIRSFVPDGNSQNLLLQNCFIESLGRNSNDASLLVNNCVVLNVGNGNQKVAATFKNCILFYVNASSISSFYNNVSGHLLSSYSGEKNIQLSGDQLKALFADGEYVYTDERTYELTAAAAQQYLGNDGTQVGIYGGDTPFTDVPTNPQITSRQIATKTDNDGKLSVKITVEAQK